MTLYVVEIRVLTLAQHPVLDNHLVVKPIVHEIRIQNQVIFLDPPIEYARETWVRQLHEWLGIICRLRRIQSSRYEIGLQMQEGNPADATYTFLVSSFMKYTTHTLTLS